MTTQREYEKRDADKRRRLREFRQRMFLALAITAGEDGVNAEYAHEDQDSLDLTNEERLDQTKRVFDTLISLAGAEGKRYLRDATARAAAHDRRRR
jgi:hypothetical protein